MADNNNETSNQPAHKNAEPVKAANPMKAANPPQMPTKLEFAQDQTKGNSAQEDDSK